MSHNDTVFQHITIDDDTKQIKLLKTTDNYYNDSKKQHIIFSNINNILKLQSIKQFLYDIFLPIDYPYSVTSDYINYQYYDTLQGLCSYLRGILCTQAVLTGLGIGNTDATVQSATLNWLIRDGCGLLGGLLFGYMNSSLFTINCKQYRIYADICNDIALALDLISPLLPSTFFLLCICLATLARSLCGICAGSTRTALIYHFAKSNNHTDLAVKEGM